MRQFNYDYEGDIPLPNYTTELWRYNYTSRGEKILKLLKPENAPDNFSSDFRIDDTETYLALVRSWVGDPEYALVIKNLKAGEDIFELRLEDLIEKYQFEPGIFEAMDWHRNYFRFQIDNPQNSSFRLIKDTWKIIDCRKELCQ